MKIGITTTRSITVNFRASPYIARQALQQVWRKREKTHLALEIIGYLEHQPKQGQQFRVATAMATDGLKVNPSAEHFPNPTREKLKKTRTRGQPKAQIDNLQKELESVKRKRAKKMIPSFDLSNKEDSSDTEEEEEEPTPKKKKLKKEAHHDLLSKEFAMVKAQLKEIMKLLTRMPGFPTPMPIEPEDFYAQSPFRPFVDAIARAPIPKILNMPTVPELYNGTTGPVEHVNRYMVRIWMLPIPPHLMEATMCRLFGTTLDGFALRWLIDLKLRSIPNFGTLVNKFYERFSCSIPIDKYSSSDLYRHWH